MRPHELSFDNGTVVVASASAVSYRYGVGILEGAGCFDHRAAGAALRGHRDAPVAVGHGGRQGELEVARRVGVDLRRGDTDRLRRVGSRGEEDTYRGIVASQRQSHALDERHRAGVEMVGLLLGRVHHRLDDGACGAGLLEDVDRAAGDGFAGAFAGGEVDRYVEAFGRDGVAQVFTENDSLDTEGGMEEGGGDVAAFGGDFGAFGEEVVQESLAVDVLGGDLFLLHAFDDAVGVVHAANLWGYVIVVRYLFRQFVQVGDCIDLSHDTYSLMLILSAGVRGGLRDRLRLSAEPWQMYH